MMKLAAYLSGLTGLALAVALVVHDGVHGIFAILLAGGWPLFLLAPVHLLVLALDAMGWRRLLFHRDEAARIGRPLLTWIATIREAVNALLPVARIGGELVGIRLAAARGVPGATAAASVIVEVTLTLISQFVFVLLGVILLLFRARAGGIATNIAIGLCIALPLTAAAIFLQRHASLFERLARFADRLLPFERARLNIESAAQLDAELGRLYSRRGALVVCVVWQLCGLAAGAAETWLAALLLHRPISIEQAVVLESLAGAIRHLAFVVPAGIGVQEAGFMALGQLIGVPGDMAIALSFAKRLREIVLGVPALLSWQYMEGKRLRKPAGDVL